MHVIFDLDDTLIESFPTYARLHQEVAASLGLPVPAREALVPYAASWEETLARLWPAADIPSFMSRYDVMADGHPYPALPGVHQALARLREAGHPLWIVTKRTRRRLADRMRQAGLEESWFRGVFPAEEQPAIKPDPRCFEPVWRTAGERALAIYVGDRDEDRRAAEAAGIGFVAVRTGPESELGFPGDLDPARVIGSVADLPAWLAA